MGTLRRTAGFSLVELLVASFLASVVLTSLVGFAACPASILPPRGGATRRQPDATPGPRRAQRDLRQAGFDAQGRLSNRSLRRARRRSFCNRMATATVSWTPGAERSSPMRSAGGRHAQSSRPAASRCLSLLDSRGRLSTLVHGYAGAALDTDASGLDATDRALSVGCALSSSRAPRARALASVVTDVALRTAHGHLKNLSNPTIACQPQAPRGAALVTTVVLVAMILALTTVGLLVARSDVLLFRNLRDGTAPITGSRGNHSERCRTHAGYAFDSLLAGYGSGRRTETVAPSERHCRARRAASRTRICGEFGNAPSDCRVSPGNRWPFHPKVPENKTSDRATKRRRGQCKNHCDEDDRSSRARRRAAPEAGRRSSGSIGF